MWNHWVIRTHHPHQPFKDFDTARWSWSHLSNLFPGMLAGVLMPNHVHLILPAHLDSGGQMNRTLGGFMAGISLKEGKENFWQPIPPPSLITPDKLAINIRYLALNPCRKSLCSDPLQWYWSTYREIMGACIPAFGRSSSGTLTSEYTDRERRTIQALRESKHGFRVRFHTYVSADPSVAVAGTPAPKAAPPSDWAKTPLEEILAAAAGALRVSVKQVRKRGTLRTLFIQLAYRQGWRKHTPLLAMITGSTEGSIRRTLKHPPPVGIEAADLCLGDPRLRMKISLDAFLK